MIFNPNDLDVAAQHSLVLGGLSCATKIEQMTLTYSAHTCRVSQGVNMKQIPIHLTIALLLGLSLPTPALAQVFTAPLVPPEMHYVVEAVVDLKSMQLSGQGSVKLRNVGKHNVSVLKIRWFDWRSGSYAITFEGLTKEYPSSAQSIDIVLAKLLEPGASLDVGFRFTRAVGDLDRGFSIQRWFPQLWWGYETHASYDVSISVPADLIVGATGRRDAATGRYRAEHVRTFGLYLARGHEVAETEAGPTLVRSIFRPDMRECAELVLKTAADAINFYRQRFGMYPQPILTIIPGGAQPVGGYPYATAVIVVHGQEACAQKPRDTHWRWIAAHEVAHQYWIEHVMEKDPEAGYGWLLLGLGIWSDREYARARGFDSKHREWLEEYASTARKGLNTTVEIPLEELRKLDFDYNTKVTHAKGFGIVSALAAIVGHNTFERIYQRALREYAGRRLGTAEFRRVAEEESGQDLGWFFVPLLRTNRFASYEISRQTTTREGERQVVRVQVTSNGNLLLPVPVEAQFANGERQRLILDRTREEQTLEFAVRAPLAEVVIDPDHEFPLVIPPPEITATRLAELVDALPWSGGGEKPLRLYHRAVELDVKVLNVWTRLGLTLFDSQRYPESLDAFNRAAPLVPENSLNWRFATLAWRGMLNDLLGHRDIALDYYRQALRLNGNPAMQHTQFGLIVDRAWIEKRLESPFTWPMTR